MKAVIILDDGETKYRVPAKRTNVPGLLVTEVNEYSTITHAASGYRISEPIALERDAFTIVEKLGQLDIDWTLDIERLKAQIKERNLRDIVYDILGLEVK